MEKLLIPLGIMVGLSLLGWLTQRLKNAQDRRQAERDRERRLNSPTAPVVTSSATAKPAAADLNRFMAEIDKLRQRGAPGEAPPTPVARTVATAIPVAKAAKKVRLGESLPSTFETTAAPIQSRSINPADDLPVAAVVGPTFASTPAPTATVKSGSPTVTAAPKAVSGATKYKDRNLGPTTPFGRQLIALLGNPQSLPMAVVLHEILGPPKYQTFNPHLPPKPVDEEKKDEPKG